ncbi:MAG: hypothetical protein ACRDND_09755 [Streptosporangiaceae bacterium]
MAYMSFFDDMPPAEPEPPRVHHPWEPPEAEFPAVVPSGPLMLGRAGRAAVAVTAIAAYSTGFEIFVTARLRPGAGAGSGPGDRMPGGPEPRVARRSFRFGVQLADGTKVIGQHGPGPAGDADPDGPILRTFLGGGGPRSHFWRWWAWPLPPAGPLEFICEWPGNGIPETRTAIDAQLILDASGRSIQLWPEEEG